MSQGSAKTGGSMRKKKLDVGMASETLQTETGIIGELLATTGKELKGKLKPAEVVVENQTLIEATRAQNKALIFIHEQLQSLHCKLDVVEANFTKRIGEVEVKIGQWGDRVVALEKKVEVGC